MGLTFSHFTLQKEGMNPEQNEDAVGANLLEGRFAIADGASDSYDSGRWARLLVSSFVDHGLGNEEESDLLQWVAPLADQWRVEIPFDDLKWYQFEKAKLGAYATFVGLRVDPPLEHGSFRTWTALALGDACLFLIRNGKLAFSFPLETPEAFNAAPPMLSTIHSQSARALHHRRVAGGELFPGDALVLGSDALAQWLLASAGMDTAPWLRIASITAEEFAGLVSELRQERKMRNDDVTLLTVALNAE